MSWGPPSSLLCHVIFPSHFCKDLLRFLQTIGFSQYTYCGLTRAAALAMRVTRILFSSLRYMFGSLLDHFVSSFVRVYVLLTFKFDAVWFMNFSAEFWNQGTEWIGSVILSLILRIQDRKIYFEVYDVSVSILNNTSSAASLIQWWVPTVLYFFWDFFWRSGLWEY